MGGFKSLKALMMFCVGGANQLGQCKGSWTPETAGSTCFPLALKLNKVPDQKYNSRALAWKSHNGE